MNIRDYWHIKLAEECAEVQHRCMKVLQYGPDETQPGHTHDNETRLRAELLDLLSVIDLMQMAGAIGVIGEAELNHARNLKREKLAKYFKLSFNLGRIEIGGPVSPP